MKPKPHTKEAFVRMPLWWAAAATKATRTPKALVCIELLYASWKARSPTVSLSSARLKQLGVDPRTKCRALRELEAAGLISVEWIPGRSPLVTLLAVCG
jgi:hypothetical protein